MIFTEKEFLIQVEAGLEFITENDALVTLGITPHRPETAYGYIQIDGRVPFRQMNNLFKVKTFTEKPGLEMANVFIESGEFFWNAGIFIWQLKGILQAFDTWLPDMASLFKRGEKLYGTETRYISLIRPIRRPEHIDRLMVLKWKSRERVLLCSDFGGAI